MLPSLRNRGTLCLISIAAGWGVTGLVCDVLAEAHWHTVLWAFFTALFLIPALGCGLAALILMLLGFTPSDGPGNARSLPRRARQTMMTRLMPVTRRIAMGRHGYASLFRITSNRMAS